MCFSGNGMIEAMLEPHIKDEAGGTQFDVAVTFLVMGGCYMLTTPIWGHVRGGEGGGGGGVLHHRPNQCR